MADNWRESMGGGLRRDHRASCLSTSDRKPNRRCGCPYTFALTVGPKQRVRARLDGSLSLTAAMSEKARMVAAARDAVERRVSVVPPTAVAVPTLYAFAKQRFADRLAPRRQITTDRYETAYRLRVHQWLGGHRLDELTPAIVRDWCDELVTREGDRRSGHEAFGALRWLLGEAVGDQLVTYNAAAAIPYAKRARAAVQLGAPSAADHATKKAALNREQYDRLVEHAATVGLRELVLIRLAVEGTLRRAELAGLRWGDVDTSAHVAHVTGGVTHTKTTGTVRGAAKTRTSHRAVVMCTDLCRVLDQYRRVAIGSEPEHYVLPGQPNRKSFDPAAPVVPNSLSKRAHDLVRDAGLVDDEGEPLTNLHGLRSTGNSIAAAAGIGKVLRYAQMGHTGDDMHERTYVDVRSAPERFQFADVFEPADRAVDPEVDPGGPLRHLRLVAAGA